MSPEEQSTFWRTVQVTVDKDVVRTDRSNQFFRGDGNPNVESMRCCTHPEAPGGRAAAVGGHSAAAPADRAQAPLASLPTVPIMPMAVPELWPSAALPRADPAADTMAELPEKRGHSPLC